MDIDGIKQAVSWDTVSWIHSKTFFLRCLLRSDLVFLSLLLEASSTPFCSEVLSNMKNISSSCAGKQGQDLKHECTMPPRQVQGCLEIEWDHIGETSKSDLSCSTGRLTSLRIKLKAAWPNWTNVPNLHGQGSQPQI